MLLLCAAAAAAAARLTLGRLSHEQAVIMPDLKTMYTTDDVSAAESHVNSSCSLRESSAETAVSGLHMLKLFHLEQHQCCTMFHAHFIQDYCWPLYAKGSNVSHRLPTLEPTPVAATAGHQLRSVHVQG
jgi:hypothetical protein